MPFAPPVSAIIAETHDRFWNLPDFVRERERLEHNAYMRNYMRTYRRASKPLNVTLSKEQRRRIDAAALAAGYLPTTFLRKAALAYLDEHIVLPKSFEQALFDAKLEIRRIGNNINQIARHANTTRHATRRELDHANKQLEELQKTIDRFVPSLPAEDDR